MMHIKLGNATYHAETERLQGEDGQQIHLRLQSANVLKYFAAALGQLVTRDDLITEIWPDIAVTDDSLTQCIADIRRAIGDHDRAILKTVPKRGYILMGTRATPPAAQVHDPHYAQVSNQPAAPIAEMPTAIIPQLDPLDVLPTLAILPFQSSAAGEAKILGTFFADEIANAIGRTDDVNVISRLSSGSATVQARDLRGIGKQLNADFVLSGTLFQQETKAIVVVEFAETESQFVLWSDRMELEIDPLLRETEGINQIVTHVRRAIMLNEVRRVRSRPLNDLRLFSALHGAVGLMHRFSPTDFKLAREYLEFVVSRAPNHPAPLAWLGRWHVLRTVQGWADDAKHEANQALGFTARALDIDPDHSLALVCEGQALVHLAHRLDDAKDRYDAALISNPNDAQGRALRGMLASFQDRGDEGKRDAERALHLTPLDPHRFFYLALAAGANIAAEDYPRAVSLAKESLRLNRTHVSTLRTLAVAQVGMGDNQGARKTADELLRLQPDLRVSSWLKNSPGSEYQMARSAAAKLLSIGIPD